MSSSIPANPTPHHVLALVQKLSDADPDFRFMSLNDLLQVLANAKSDFLHTDYNIAARTVDGVVKVLDDQNGEVQNLAIKCLGPLVSKVPTPIVGPLLEKVSCLRLQHSVDSAVPSLALREVILALPRPTPGIPPTLPVIEAYNAIGRVLIPRLLGPTEPPRNSRQHGSVTLPVVPEGLLQNDRDLHVESLDVLIELVRCFGPMLMGTETEQFQNAVMGLLESDRTSSAVKKRAVTASSILAVYLSDRALEAVVERMVSGLKGSQINATTRRHYISIAGSIARSIPHRFGRHLPVIAPLIFRTLGEAELQRHLNEISDGEDVGPEFNEIRESALIALEGFLAACPQEMRPYTEETIAACIRFLKYDPNYAMNDDDDEDMEEDEEDEEDDEFEADPGFDDDDDASWKVRRCAAKALYTLILTRGSGDLLENGVLYHQAGPALVKRFEEREESVRLEVISALSLLVRKTGEGVFVPGADEDPDAEPASPTVAVSRKRRRQSSTSGGSQFAIRSGLGSPTLERAPSFGPRSDLARLTPSIAKASLKPLKGRLIPTKQAIINLLDDIVTVQRGGLADHFSELMDFIIDAINPTGTPSMSSSLVSTGGSASATPSTLRVAALKLTSDIAKTHSSSLLQPYLTKIVSKVVKTVHDRFYKISYEAVRTVEELVKAITPPRSKNTALRFKGELDKLYDVIMDRTSAQDADTEVRQRAIHALGILLARTAGADASSLLSPEKRRQSLAVLLDRLKNETTRLAAVRAIDTVAAHTTSSIQIEKKWTQEVTLELSAQLRKANRALRGSSIQALKHLTSSPASKGQLDANTIQGLVLALVPVVANNDTHLLGPALLVLATLVHENAGLVVIPSTTSALCSLLKSSSANMVSDQILVLVTAIGQSGTGASLMAGLLKDVSIDGDPTVVGKVIGTLLVAAGSSSGVTIDSFISELHSSAKKKDNPRVSLALSILGEAGMRLGAQSPLLPDLFLEQFHDEPDRVSLSAAVALGRAGSGNIPKYLPVILRYMRKSGHRQYLLIQSIKEILQQVANPPTTSEMSSYSEQIWQQLLAASETADNKVICAECVGRLVVIDPNKFMPQLKALLKNQNPSLRGMAVQAIRYTLPDSDETFDAMLQTELVGMILTMLQDSDMDIRRLAMMTLNSAAHNKPDLILPRLSEIMPFVLHESVIKPELVREVMMGPFKTKVDDGLEVRKSAYETLYALMETAFSRINNIDFYDRVVAGLSDDNDIRSLCNLMVSKLMILDPDETLRRLDAMADAFRKTLSTKLKDTAVKQELEKQEEANKSVLRVTLLLNERLKDELSPRAAAGAGSGGAGSGGGNGAGAGSVGHEWVGYWEWVNKEFEKQLKGLREEHKELQTRM